MTGLEAVALHLFAALMGAVIGYFLAKIPPREQVVPLGAAAVEERTVRVVRYRRGGNWHDVETGRIWRTSVK